MRGISAAGAIVIGLVFPCAALAQSDAEREAIARVQEMREEKQYIEALALLDTLLLQHPDSRYLRQLYPWIYLFDLASPETALEKALELRRDYPDYSQGYYWEARSHDEMGDWASCLRALKEYPEFERRFARHTLTAACYYMVGQYEEALAALPSREDLGQGYENMEGWHIWLQGQVARRPLFASQKEELRAAAQSEGPRQRAVALIKLGLLGVPESAELVKLVGDKGPDDLSTAATNLHAILVAKPRFYRDRPRYPVPFGAEAVATETALAQIWAELDRAPEKGEIPAVEGAWLTEQIAELAKSYPSAAQPMKILVNDSRDSWMMSGGEWIGVDGEIDMSFEPGRWYSFQSLRGGDLETLAVGLRKEGTDVTITTYRRDGEKLVLDTRVWVDAGEVYYLFSSSTAFLPFER